MIYFTADTHFGHENVIRFCNRPFENKHQMDHKLIENINKTVKEEDTLYFLGDFSLSNNRDYIESIVRKINCENKILILGNHDILKPFAYVECGFKSVHTSLLVGGFMLVHDPSLAIIDKDTPHLCGHVHDLFDRVANCYNVGVDIPKHNYSPVSIEMVTQW